MNISETRRTITIKFYLKHHWGGGKAELGFGSDQIKTLVPMATGSSKRVIMKCCGHSSAFIFDRTFFILAGNEAKFGQFRSRTAELAALSV